MQTSQSNTFKGRRFAIGASILLISLIGVAPLLAEDGVPPGVDAVITMENIETEGWRVLDTRGEGPVPVGDGRVRLGLEIDRRYHFDLSSIDSELFAFEFRDRQGNVLFSQFDPETTEELSGVDPEISDDGITFTLTEELSRRIDTFRATHYPAMVGFIRSFDPDAIEAAAAEESTAADIEAADAD